MKTKNIFVVFAFFAATMAHAQTEDKVVSAFSKSYEYEYGYNYAKAIESLNAVYVPESYELNLRLGWLWYMNADYVKSQSYYKKAASMESSSIEARMGYINATAVLENWDDVLNMYKEVLKIDPNHSTANYRLAYIYFVRKDFNSAIIYAKKAASLYPFDYDTNILAAKLYVSLGQVTDAKKHYRRALCYSPISQEAIEAMKNLK